MTRLASTFAPYLHAAAEALLLDGPAGGLYGGAGHTFDWGMARGAAMRIVLAGGLDASNVARAVSRLRDPGAWMRVRASKARREKRTTRKCSHSFKPRKPPCRPRPRRLPMTSQPDAGGHFGPYGGRFVPEVLMAPIEELEKAYLEARDDAGVSGRTGRPAAQLRGPPDAAVLTPSG